MLIYLVNDFLHVVHGACYEYGSTAIIIIVNVIKGFFCYTAIIIIVNVIKGFSVKLKTNNS